MTSCAQNRHTQIAIVIGGACHCDGCTHTETKMMQHKHCCTHKGCASKKPVLLSVVWFTRESGERGNKPEKRMENDHKEQSPKTPEHNPEEPPQQDAAHSPAPEPAHMEEGPASAAEQQHAEAEAAAAQPAAAGGGNGANGAQAEEGFCGKFCSTICCSWCSNYC